MLQIYFTENGNMMAGKVTLLASLLSLTYPGTSAIQLTVAVDNVISIYVDGVFMRSHNGWRPAEILDITEDTKVVALEIWVNYGACGVVANVGGIWKTDRTWKCSDTNHTGWTQIGFDDQSWEDAVELGPAGMSPWGGLDPHLTGAQWIKPDGDCGTDNYMFCRKYLRHTLV